MKQFWKIGWSLAALLLILAASQAQSETTLRAIPLNDTAHQFTFSLIAGTPAQLSNEFTVPLHHTTIIMEPNFRMGVIRTMQPGQTVNLEFSQEGRYSICFSFSPDETAGPSHCIPVEVQPRRTA